MRIANNYIIEDINWLSEKLSHFAEKLKHSNEMSNELYEKRTTSFHRINC